MKMKKQTKEERRIVLRDRFDKDKTLEFGEPFLSDGSFWLTIRIKKEIVGTIKLIPKELQKMYNHLSKYALYDKK